MIFHFKIASFSFYISDEPSGSGRSNSVSDNQVVLNTGGDQYQTVTIVPSDGNTGEVSYVLIVQQPDDDKDKDDGDEMGVYDFDGKQQQISVRSVLPKIGTTCSSLGRRAC